jgi:hypothetical protein
MDTDKKADGTRSLLISDFRNLGVSALRKKKGDRTFLKINRSLEKEEIGGLVIILGGNNCGKTNVLDAVAKYPRQEFTEDDRTDFTPSRKTPRLEMKIGDLDIRTLIPPRIMTGSGRCRVMGSVPDVLLYILRQKESYALFREWAEKEGRSVNEKDYINDLEWHIRAVCREGHDIDCRGYAYVLRNRPGLFGQDLEAVANDLEDGSLSSYKGELDIQVEGSLLDSVIFADYRKVPEAKDIGKVPSYEFTENLEEYYASQGKLKNITRKVSKTLGIRKEYDPTNDVILIDLPGEVKTAELFGDDFSKRYGYNLSNRIYRYTQNRISHSDLTCNAKSPNQFISHIFSLLGYKNESIINRYYDNNDMREKTEKDLNEKLRPISDSLNILLNSSEKEYELSIRLEKEQIIFSISCGDGIKLNLDHQSEGFRWLFGFFINFLMSNKFFAGDIVVIDEFGGLLNFGTVKELSKKLRDFSRESGITFIMATQNPMAVDISHLDEVRMVVPRNDGSSEILNDFTEFGKGECMDVLRPIVASMTVSRNYLRSEERVTVFVENYRDYFILSGFSQSSDLDVIPVNGITDTSSAKDLAKVLRTIERYPILLADEDMHDSGFMDELKAEGVKVYTVSEVFEGEKESLVDLFSDEDLSRLKIEGASFDTMACISRSISSGEKLSKDTEENFGRLLDYISME